MSYLAKQTVLNHIKARKIRHGDSHYTIFEAYLGTDPYTKKPVRKTAKTAEKLEKIVNEFYKRRNAGGDAAVLLTPFQSVDARSALDMLAKAGMDISLSECVRRIVERKDETLVCEVTLAEAYEKYEQAQAGKSEGHQNAVKARVGKWLDVFGRDRLVSDVTAQEVSKDLEGRVYDPAKPKTKTTFNNHLGYIKTFMEWCAAPEQAYIKESPLSAMKLKTKEWRAPEYLTFKDTRRLFERLEANAAESPSDLADAILSFFCGMRQEEIERVREGEEAVRISIEKRNIRIIKVKGHLRGIKPRSFTIPNQALAWMQSFDFMNAIMQPNRKFREHLVRHAKELKISLPINVGRHTFITMHAAAYHDQALLSSIAGNTEDVRSRNYDGLTDEEEGRAYFETILPKVAGSTPATPATATDSSESA